MLNLLQSIFRASSDRKGLDEALIDRATERVIDGTDPRLRALNGYRRKLRGPVTRAVEHVIALVDSLPAPREISRKQYSTDPHLRAFFVSADHLREVVSYSEDLQKYLQGAGPSMAESLFCLLTLDRSEKGVLGMALRGDAVSKDVAQVVVNFSNHRLVGFAECEDDMRWELKKRAFDHLIETALEHLTTTREQARALERQQRLLGKKLDAIRAANLGMSTLLESTGDPDPAPGSVEQQLAEIEAELANLGADTSTLDGQLASIAATLDAPATHLRLERRSVTLDSMGIRLDGAASETVPPLELLEIVGGERRRVMLPGFVIRAELLPPRDFLREAQRRLQVGR